MTWNPSQTPFAREFRGHVIYAPVWHIFDALLWKLSEFGETSFLSGILEFPEIRIIGRQNTAVTNSDDELGNDLKS